LASCLLPVQTGRRQEAFFMAGSTTKQNRMALIFDDRLLTARALADRSLRHTT
jgi:hypothetical protein